MTERQRGWLLPPLAVCFSLGILTGRAAVSLWYGVIGCITGVSACVLLKGRWRFCALLALFMALGCVRGFQGYHPVLPDEGIYTVSGILSEDLQARDNGSFRSVLTDVTLNGNHLDKDVYWSFYADEAPSDLIPGMQITLDGKLYHPPGATNPDGYDFREELLRRGITVGIYGRTNLESAEPEFFSFSGFLASLRHQLRTALVDALGNETGLWASAMLLGSKSLLPREDRQAFSRLGVAHLLSVSGFHTGVLAVMLVLLFRLFHLPQRIRIFLLAIFLSVYCILCGWSQPVLRASLLLLFGMWGRILNRPRILLHLLSAAFLILLFFYPVQLTGLSFLMSFGAVLGIAIFPSFLRSLWNPKSLLLQWLRNMLSVGMSAQIGVFLPVLYAYQELPILGILVNIPIGFLGSGLIWLYWLVLFTLPFPFFSGIFSTFARFGTNIMLSAVRFLGNLPGITLWTRAAGLLTAVGVILLGIGICAVIRLKPRFRVLFSACGLLLIILSLISPLHLTTEYYQLDEGNADSAVLWDQNQVIVIDTGDRDGFLSFFLHRRRLTPDAVILSHLHSDHFGGLEALMEDGIPIPLVYIPDRASEANVHPDALALLDRLETEGTEIRTLEAGDTLFLPSGEMRILWPEKGKTRQKQNANESSLVLRIDIRGSVLLQTGDLDGRYEMYAAAPANLLKAAHHGSQNSSSPAFLAAVQPQTILLSCSDKDTQAAFSGKAGNARVFSTASNGMLTVHFNDQSYTVETFLSTPEVISSEPE